MHIKSYKHIVLSNINKQLENLNVVNKKQHGFRSGLYCTTLLIESINDWASELDRKQASKVCQVDTILLDFSKAFDRVPHAKLLEKLKFYGIRGPMLNLTEYFLIGCTPKIYVNGIRSSPINVTSSVPQSCVLGPTLRLLYINGIDINVNNRPTFC